MKKFVLVGVVVVLVSLAITLIPEGKISQISFPNGHLINVELADTPEERKTGLMYRESLLQNRGMLFIYENEAIRTFWMKNTLIPLDMIFLNKDFEIVDILEGVPPCEKDPCPIYPSKGEAQYVLEVNSGLSEISGLAVGQTLQVE